MIGVLHAFYYKFNDHLLHISSAHVATHVKVQNHSTLVHML